MSNSHAIALNKRILVNREDDWKLLYVLTSLFIPVVLAALAVLLYSLSK
jgi:hypothetical protein